MVYPTSITSPGSPASAQSVAFPAWAVARGSPDTAVSAGATAPAGATRNAPETTANAADRDRRMLRCLRNLDDDIGPPFEKVEWGRSHPVLPAAARSLSGGDR